jgi:ABC-type multidrug transport system ATPase subunit
MMCIIGPSGSGKSTLLEILAGQRRPKSGSVKLNGISLYERQKRLSPLISFMPQEEALGEKLTAREHLAHAAAIRRPHLSESAIDKRVSFLLGELGLDRIGDRRVGSPESKSLSGGERSRLNAGLDLIGGGEIFLFDEPISGLSSKDAENVIESLHGLAQDKIVVASLHRPSEKVLDAFDLVLLLDRGGKMAFFGSPEELRSYFDEAFRDLEVDPARTPTARGADFVFEVLETSMLKLNPGSKARRRFPPEFWQERFENHRILDHLSRSTPATGEMEIPMADDQIHAPEPPAHGRRQKWMIFKTHLARSAKSKYRHRGTFFSAFLEAPLLAALIGLTLRASPDGSYQFHSALHLPSYLFLAVTVAMFFGLTNSATEILRDRPLLRRERNCRPHPLLYLAAKFIVLTALISLQAAVFVFVSQAILDLEGMFWIHLGWMILTGCCGTSLALLISVISKSERTALGAIPLTLVPQILLAGALIPFAEMNRGLFVGGDEGRDAGGEPVPSTIMPLRYAFEGSIVSQATENLFEKSRQPLQESIDELKQKSELAENEQRLLTETGEKLRVLYAALAPDDDLARKILDDPLAELKRLQSGSAPPPGEEDRPVSQFFINDRVDGMIELAETLRIDERRSDQPLIFMAREKPVFGVNVSTQTYCRGFLILLTLFFFLPASVLLHYSITKH